MYLEGTKKAESLSSGRGLLFRTPENGIRDACPKELAQQANPFRQTAKGGN